MINIEKINYKIVLIFASDWYSYNARESPVTSSWIPLNKLVNPYVTWFPIFNGIIKPVLFGMVKRWMIPSPSFFFWYYIWLILFFDMPNKINTICVFKSCSYFFYVKNMQAQSLPCLVLKGQFHRRHLASANK